MGRSSVMRLLTFLFVVFTTSGAFAASFSSSTSGNWTSAATWGGAGVPTAGDSVTINNAHTVTLTANTSIADLTVSSGGTLDQSSFTLTVTGSLDLSGTITGSAALNVNAATFSWSSGTLSGSGSVSFSAATAVAASGFLIVNARPITNNGTITLGSAAHLRGANGTVLTNNGTIDSAYDTGSDVCCTGTATLINAGTLVKSGGSGASTIGWLFQNQSSGSVQSSSIGGTLQFTNLGNSGGAFTANPSATLRLSGNTMTLDASTNLSGSGNVILVATSLTDNGDYNVTGTTRVQSGATTLAGNIVSVGALTVNGGALTLNSASTITLPSLSFSSGTLAGTAPITISGSPFDWSGGVLSGSGTFTLPATTNLSGFVTFDGRPVTNSGTITMTTTSSWLRGGNGTVLTNSGTIDMAADNGSDVCCSGTAAIINSGTIKKSGGTSNSTLAWPLTNQTGGTVDVQSGTLQLYNLGASTGGFTVSPSATLYFASGGASLDAASSISGGGNVTFVSSVSMGGTYNITGGTTATSGTTTLGGTITSLGPLTINGGTLNLNSASTLTVPSLTLSAGTLGGSAPVTVSSPPFNWSGGTVSGSGTLTLPSTTNISSFVTIDARPITNAGTINLTTSSSFMRGGNGTVLSNSGTIDFAADGSSDVCCSGTASINNSGTIKKSAGSGISSLAWTLTNQSTGQVNAQSGTLNVYNVGTSDGTFTASPSATLGFINSGGTLLATSTINGGGTVSFSAASFASSGTYNVTGTTSSGGGATSLTGTITSLGALSLSGGTLTLDSAGTLTVPTLAMSAGILTGTAPITISNAPFNWSAGTISGPGTLTLPSATTITGFVTLDQRPVTNSGTITLTNSSSWLRGGNGTVLTNSGTLDLAADTYSDVCCTGTAALINSGTVKKSAGTGAATLAWPLTNQSSGQVLVQSGTLQLYNIGSSSGLFNAAGGATLAFSNTGGTLDASSTISGAGNVNFSAASLSSSGTYNVTGTTSNSNITTLGGTITSIGALTVTGGTFTLNAPGTLTLPSLAMSGGTLGGTASLTITNSPFNWSSGVIGGSGTLTLPSTTNVTGFVMLDGRQVTNSGVLELTNTSAWLRGTNNTVITNTGTIDLAADTNSDVCCTGSATILNSGTLKKSAGSGTSSMSWLVTNQTGGQVLAQTGTLQLHSLGTSTGLFNVSSGATLHFYNIGGTLDASSTISGAGNVNFGASSLTSNGTYNITGSTTSSNTTTLNGTITSLGALAVNGGTLTLNSASTLTVPSLSFTSGTITGSAPLTITNSPFNWSGGVFSGPGALTLPATTNISGFITLDARPVTNSGTITLTSTSAFLRGNNGTVITNSGTIDSAADTSSDTCCSGAATINNSGTIKKSAGTSTSSLAWTVNNLTGGQVLAQSGTLQLYNIGGSTGLFNAAAGATLNFYNLGGTLDANSTISGAGNVLFNASSLTSSGTYNITGSTASTAGTQVLSGTLTSLGALTINGGSLTLNSAGTLTVPSLAMTSGTLTGTAPVTVSGSPFAWSGGTISGGGTLTLPATTNITGFITLDGRPVTNSGTINLTSTSSWLRGAGGTVITNSGTIDLAADTNSDVCCSGTATINNSGTIRKSAGAGTSNLAWTLSNQTGGQVQAQSGTLQLYNIGASTGAFGISSGATLYFYNIGGTLDASSSISGAGNVVFYATSLAAAGTYNVTGSTTATGGTTTIGGTLTSTGALTINGGTLNLNSASTLTVPTLNISSGTLGGSAPITVAGSPFNWSGGVLGGSGAFTFPTTTNITGFITLDGRPATNNGTINLTSTSSWLRGANGTVLTNNGTLDFAADTGSDICCSGGASIVNNGLFKKSAGTGNSNIAWGVNNTAAGTIKPVTGAFYFAGSYISSGTINFPIASLTSYGKLTFAGSLGFAGNLVATTTGGYTPTIGDQFTIMTFTSAGGAFATKALTYPGGKFTDSQSASSLKLTAAAATCSTPATGIVSWYRAEGDAVDGIGPNSGTAQGGATFGVGKVAQAFSFNGSGAYVSIPDNASLHTASLTAEGWVNFTSVPGGAAAIFGKTYGTGIGDSWIVWHDGTTLHASIDAAGSGTDLTYTMTPTPGTWYHVALTYDSATSTQSLYLDGAQVATGTTAAVLNYDTHPMLIGAEYNSETIGTYFHGLVDELTLYNRALTTTEVQTVFNVGANGKCYTPPTAPAISGFSPSSGPIGTVVTITGSGFTNASSVKFNGNSASFTVDTAAQITATVPASASTGLISVATAGGTANSATSFLVDGNTHWLGGNGNWSDPTKWSSGAAPASSQIAYIDASGSYTVTLDIAHATVQGIGIGPASGTQTLALGANQLTLTSGTSTVGTSGALTANGAIIDGAGTLALGGSATLTNVQLNSSTLHVTTGGTLALAGALLNAETLTNDGTVTMTGDLKMQSGTAVTITNNSAWNLSGDVSLLANGCCSAAGTLTNFGSITKTSGTGNSDVGAMVSIVNAGSVVANTGALRIAGVLGIIGGSAGGTEIDVNGGSITVGATCVFTPTTTTISGGGITFSGQTFSVTSLTVSGGFLDSTVPTSTASLSFTGGTISGSGGLTVNGPTSWSGGTLSGKLTIPASQTLTISGPVALSNGDLTNFGTVNYLASGSVTLISGASSVIHNNSVFNIQGDVGFAVGNCCSPAGTIVNTATLTKAAGTGSSSVASLIQYSQSSGSTQINSGTLNLGGGGSIGGGSVNVAASATLQLGGGTLAISAPVNAATGTVLVTGAAATINGTYSAGTTNVQSGTLDFAGAGLTNALALSGGTLTGSGGLTLTGNSTWSGGTLAGLLTVASTKTLTLPSGAPIFGSGHLINNGTLDWTGAALSANSGGGAILDNNGTFNFPDATLTANGCCSPALTINNHGTLNKPGAGTAAIANLNTLNNDAALNVNAGTLQLFGGGAFPAGTVTIAGTLEIAGGVWTSSSSISGAGTFKTTGGSFTSSGSLNLGSLIINSGTLTLSTSGTASSFTLAGGQLAGAGGFTVNGPASWTGGTLTGALTVPVSFTLSMPSGTPIFGAGAHLTNNGTVSLSAPTLNTSSGASSVIDNHGDFYAHANTNVFTIGCCVPALTFNNAGNFYRDTTSGAFTFPALTSFNNSGVLDIQSGILAINSFVQTATGTTKAYLINAPTPGTGYTQLSLGTNPTLGGTLNVYFVGGYVPAGGDAFRVIPITGGSFANNGITVNPPPLSGGGKFWTNAFDGAGYLMTVSGGGADLAPQLSNATVVISQPFNYPIAVQNGGPDPAANVTATIAIPAGTTYNSVTAGAPWSCSFGSGAVTCAATSLPVGLSSNISINLTAPSSPATLAISATASTSTSDPNAANNTASATITVSSASADVSTALSQSASTVTVGAPVTYTATVTNNGPSSATNVVAVVKLATNQTFTSATAGCTASSNVVTCNVGTLSSGNSATLTVTATASAGGTAIVSASATANEADPAPANNNSGNLACAVLGSNTMTVVANTDAGSGSLRQAIIDAIGGVCTAPCTIAFNLPAGSRRILPLSPYNVSPTSQLIIDATTQPGYSGTPLVIVDGSLCNCPTPMFTLQGPGETLAGLSIVNAPSGAISLAGPGGTILHANSIGLEPSGTIGPNGNPAVRLTSSNNVIGGTTPAAGNVIANNTGAGIAVDTSSTGNQILGNSIHHNTGLGIDLNSNGVADSNDAGDTDSGGDGTQNTPLLSSATIVGANVVVQLSADGASSAGRLLVEVFKSDAANAEGAVSLGRACVTNGFSGTQSFPVGTLTAGNHLVATSTSYAGTSCTTVADGTSEFSNAVSVTACTPPPVAITGPSSFCAGGSATLDAGFGFATYLWSNGATTQTITVTAPGTYSVTVTTGTGCTNSASKSVSQSPQPTPSITGPSAACPGNSITLDAGPGFASYLWSNSATTQTITVTQSATTTYSVTVSDGACTGSASKTVTMATPPTVVISGPSSVCPGTNFTLDAGPGFTTYFWSNGAQTQTITFSQTAPSQTYSVTVTDANGCSSSANKTVTLSSGVSATINAPPTANANATGLTASVPNVAGATYAWTITNGTITAGQGTPSITFSVGVANATLGVTVTSGSCTASGTHTVRVNNVADLAVHVTAAPEPVSAGASLTYTIQLTNQGPTPAANATVTANLPPNVTFVSAGGAGWSCLGIGPVQCSTAAAPLGAAPPITIVVKAPANSGTITNVVSVNAAAFDPVQSNNSTSATTTVTPAGANCPTVPPARIAPANGAVVSAPVTFQWSAVSGASSYDVFAGVDGGAPQIVGSTASTSLFTGLPSGAVQWFVVVHVPNCGTLSSDRGQFTVQPGTNCGAHSAPVLNAPAQNATVASPVTFNWQAVPEAVGYRVSIAANGGAEEDIGTTDGATSLTHDVPSGSIVWFVDALFGGCPSTRSAHNSFTIPRIDRCAANAAPSLLSPANNSTSTSSAIDFTWSKVANAVGYRVWASIDGAAAELLGETDSTSVHAVITSGTVDWFVEALFDGCPVTTSPHFLVTVPKAQFCGTTVATLVSPANGITIDNGLVTFTWNAVDGAAHYELWLSLNDGSPILLGSTNGTSLPKEVGAGSLSWFVKAFFDGCPPRDSQKLAFKFTVPNNCTHNRPLLSTPIDGAASVTSPVKFEWSDVGATSYKVIANGTLLGTTTQPKLANVQLATGAYDWSVEATFTNCPTLTSSSSHFVVVPQPTECVVPAKPTILAPGQTSTGIPYKVRWQPALGADSYIVQESPDASFSSPTTLPPTSETSLIFVHPNAGPNALTFFYRVRGVSNCTTQQGTFSAVVGVSILPSTSNDAAASPDAPATLTYTITLDAALAGQLFTATPTQPFLTVTPSSGTVPAGGGTLIVTANTAGLPLGTTLGSVIITTNASTSSKRGSSGSGSSSTTNLSVNVVQPVQPTPKSAPPPDALIIPAVAHADGFNAHFQSDVRLSNTSAQVMKYQVTFTPSGDNGIANGMQAQVEVDPGRTIALDDVLKTWFASGTTTGSIGTLEIRPLTQTASQVTSKAVSGLADLVTFASSRTFNNTGNGTFGQYIPGIPYANFIGKSSSTITLQQIAQSAKYRTNLGLVEGSGQAASVLLSVFGGDGKKITEIPVELKGGQHTQLDSVLAKQGLTVTDGRIEVKVVSGGGRVTAYASVLDNETSDPLLVTPTLLQQSGSSKFVLPGVADLANDVANWRTDMRLFNASSSPVQATLLFYSLNGGAPKVQQLTLAPNEVRALDNVLAGTFGVTNDGGAIHVTTASPVNLIATARTFNQTTTGTYGQFISAVTPNDAAALGTRPLQLLQVEESDRYRSNIGIAEVSGKPAKVEMTIAPPDSKVTAVVTIDLGPNEFRQLNQVLKSVGLENTFNARISVQVIEGAGRITAYASVIDSKTQDPTFVPAQ
jgi:fibronectin-binding autotransporter adhesin